METTRLLSASITPVVLISACGLVTPALYSRLGEILARIRSFHQQKIELLKGLHKHELDEQRLLLQMLDSQIDAIVVKAKVIKKSLFCLLSAIASFLLCSVLLETAEMHMWVGLAAQGMGFTGLFLFFVGLGWAMLELSLSLTPMEEERALMKIATDHYLAKSQGQQDLKLAKSA